MILHFSISESGFVRGGVSSEQNLNNLTSRGFVGSIYGVTNTPFGETWYNIFNSRHRNGDGDGNNYGSQIAILGMTNPYQKIAFRNHNAGTWQPWNELWHTGNLNRLDTDFSANNITINSQINSANGNGRIILSGNLHIDSFNGNDIYLNYYSNRAIQYFGHSNHNGYNVSGIQNLTAYEIYSGNWFRSTSSNTGWYSEPNAAGVYSDGYQRVRIYNNSILIVDNNIYTNGNLIVSNYGQGLIGQYDPSRYQGVFAMSENYKLSYDGSNTGNLYGIAWTHSNVGGESIYGLEHQALFMMHGQTQTAIGNGIWTRGNITTLNNVSSSNFSPETNFLGANGAGFQITNSGGIYTLEIDNIKIRKSLLANELVLNKVRASNGSFWITDAAKVKSGINYDGNYYLRFEDDLVFQVGDIIKAQAFSSSGYYTYVYRVWAVGTDGTSAYAYIVNENGTQPTQVDLTGKEFVRIANNSNASRQGSLYLTSSDANSPYLEVLDGMNSSTISNSNRRVRLGKLDGIVTSSGKSLSGHGFYTEGNGYIAGWDITNNGLIRDTGTSSTSAGLAPSDFPFYAGSIYANRGSAPFRVTPAGAAFMTSGSIGGWLINSTSLSSSNTPGTPRVVLNSSGTKMTFYGAYSSSDDTEYLEINSSGSLGPQILCKNYQTTFRTLITPLTFDVTYTFNNSKSFKIDLTTGSYMHAYLKGLQTTGMTGGITTLLADRSTGELFYKNDYSEYLGQSITNTTYTLQVWLAKRWFISGISGTCIVSLPSSSTMSSNGVSGAFDVIIKCTSSSTGISVTSAAGSIYDNNGNALSSVNLNKGDCWMFIWDGSQWNTGLAPFTS
jgi:hypothetical protein